LDEQLRDEMVTALEELVASDEWAETLESVGLSDSGLNHADTQDEIDTLISEYEVLEPQTPAMTTPDDVAPSYPAADEPVEQRSATLAWRIAGVIGLVVAAATAWIAWHNYPLGTLDRPGSAFFPLLVAALMAVASVIALIEARGA